MGNDIGKLTGQLIKRRIRGLCVGINITKKEREVGLYGRCIGGSELELLVYSSRSSQSRIKCCSRIRGGNEYMAVVRSDAT